MRGSLSVVVVTGTDDTSTDFMKAHPEHVAEPNLMPWISNDKGETYNGCHFW